MRPELARAVGGLVNHIEPRDWPIKPAEVGALVKAADIVGAWRVLTHDLLHKDGTVSYPHGEVHPAGIIYSADGHMALVAEGKRPRRL